MPIPLSCSCGRALRVKDELAGKKIRCPDCRSILTVPAREVDPSELVLEVLPADEPEHTQTPHPSPRRSEGREVRRAAIQAEAPEVKPVRRRRDEEDDDAPVVRKRPKPRRVRERSGPSVTFERGWFGSTNAGVLGGILMVVIAVVWFVAGIVLIDRIFIYPPILLVIGLIAIIKGGLGGD